MGKTRDLFKKIRDTTGTFHAKMDSVKDRNNMDLTEAEDIKKRWQEYTEWERLAISSRNVPVVSLIFLKRSLVFPILLFSSASLHGCLRKPCK